MPNAVISLVVVAALASGGGQARELRQHLAVQAKTFRVPLTGQHGVYNLSQDSAWS